MSYFKKLVKKTFEKIYFFSQKNMETHLDFLYHQMLEKFDF